MSIRVADEVKLTDDPLTLSTPSLDRVRSFLSPHMGSLGLLIKFSADTLAAVLACTIGLLWVRASALPMPPVWMMACYPPMVLVLLGFRSSYRRSLGRTLIDEFVLMESVAAIAAMFLLAGLVLTNVHGYLGATVAKVWMVTAVLLPLGRISAIELKRAMRRRHLLQSRTLIVGNGMIANHLARRFLDHPRYGIQPVGFVDINPPWNFPTSTLPTVGTPQTMADAITRTRAEAVVIAFSQTRDQDLESVITAARLAGLTVWVVPRLFDHMSKRSRVDYVGGTPLLALAHTNPKGWQFATKDLLDRIISAVILALVSPLFVVLMAAVKLSSPGPIFFRQPRIGRDGVVFDCLKFRSMRLPSDSEDSFTPQDGSAPGGVEGQDRRTWIGRFIRSTSLDELPQLLNVLTGDMSLVGPRPERPEFVDIFNPQIRRYGQRQRVKAGMTGWAQVHGLRGQTSIADRAEWDNYYIENWSLSLDLQILLMTIPAVFHRAE